MSAALIKEVSKIMDAFFRDAMSANFGIDDALTRRYVKKLKIDNSISREATEVFYEYFDVAQREPYGQADILKKYAGQVTELIREATNGTD